MVRIASVPPEELGKGFPSQLLKMMIKINFFSKSMGAIAPIDPP